MLFLTVDGRGRYRRMLVIQKEYKKGTTFLTQTELSHSKIEIAFSNSSWDGFVGLLSL